MSATRQLLRTAPIALSTAVLLAAGCRSPFDADRQMYVRFSGDLLRTFRDQVEASQNTVHPMTGLAQRGRDLGSVRYASAGPEALDGSRSLFPDAAYANGGADITTVSNSGFAAAGQANPETDPAVTWWESTAALPVFQGGRYFETDLADTLERAMAHSTQMKVFADIPLIRRTAIQEAEGRFVPRLFAEGKYERSDQPVGSTLQTGGPDVFREDSVVGEVGIRKLLKTGGDVTLSQRVSYTDNNSVFFVPNPQARAELTLSIVQPLLEGAGVQYNQSIIQIAKIDSDIARQEFIRQTEGHLLEVVRSYWNLYLARATFLQQEKQLRETEALSDMIAGRAGVDVGSEAVARAQAEVSQLRSALVRGEMAVRNAEDRMRALLNDSEIEAGREILIQATPRAAPADIDLVDATEAALTSRPEVRQAFLQWRAAAIRLGIAENEELPQLDLIAELAVAGLDGADADEALGDQFSESGLNALVGLRFEDPLGEAGDDARALRRRLELRQQGHQVETTIETVLLEVKVSVRETATAWRELQSRSETLAAAAEDLRVLRNRWDRGVDVDGMGGVSFLDLLLSSQQRLAEAEAEYVRSQAAYQVSLTNLQRAQGTLVRYEKLELREDRDIDSLPRLRLQPEGSDAGAAEPAAAPDPQERLDRIREMQRRRGGSGNIEPIIDGADDAAEPAPAEQIADVPVELSAAEPTPSSERVEATGSLEATEPGPIDAAAVDVAGTDVITDPELLAARGEAILTQPVTQAAASAGSAEALAAAAIAELPDLGPTPLEQAADTAFIDVDPLPQSAVEALAVTDLEGQVGAEAEAELSRTDPDDRPSRYGRAVSGWQLDRLLGNVRAVDDARLAAAERDAVRHDGTALAEAEAEAPPADATAAPAPEALADVPTGF